MYFTLLKLPTVNNLALFLPVCCKFFSFSIFITPLAFFYIIS